MRLLSVAVVVVMLLSVSSCDRFKHTFEPVVTIDFETELFSPLADAFQEITSANLQPVMDFYTEDYMHNGQYKSDREYWYQTILTDYPNAVLEVEFLLSEEVNDTLAITNWRLTALDNAKVVVADSTFLGERLVKRDGRWLLYGNGDDCGCIEIVNQRALLEYFTFQTCPACPAVEELLHNLYLSYPNQMTYLEYHLNDPMQIPANSNVFQYYGLVNMPVTVFQGESVIYGNNPDNEAVYTQLILNLTNQVSKIGLTNLQHSVVANNLSGTIEIELKDQNIMQDDLKLKYVIIDRVSDQYTNSAQVPCKNVVLASGLTTLSGVDLQSPVSFSFDFTGTLPEDAFLVIWVQQLPETYDSNAAIYHALETPVNLPKF